MLKRAMRAVGAILASFFLAGPALAQPEVVSVTAKPSRAAVAPGERFAIAVVFELEEGWHINPGVPEPLPKELEDWEPVWTTITVNAPQQTTVWPTQWPKTSRAKSQGTTVLVPVYEGRAIAYIPVRAAHDAPADEALNFSIVVSYQPCDDTTCLRDEEKELQLSLPVISAAQQAQRPAAPADPDFAAFDEAVFTRSPASDLGSSSIGRAVGAGAANGRDDSVNLGFGLRMRLTVPLVLLAGLVGGFVLNLTPCVLPVIPLKIMGLSQAAAGSRSRCLFLGSMTSLGIISFWMSLGFMIAGLKTLSAVSSLFANPWFLLGVGTFIVVMALGMMGVYTFQLPQAIYRVAPKHDTAAGSFLFGVMTAVLGTPCFGPFAGGAAAWATDQSAPTAIGAFGALGLGMALPYFILAAKPEWISKVPRTGPASALVKQVMGLLLMAAGAYFIGAALVGLVAELPYLRSVVYWWFVAAFAGIAGLWLAYRTLQIAKSSGRKVIFSLMGIAIAAFAVYWAQFQTSLAAKAHADNTLWREYNPAEFEGSIAKGNVVVMDFTAEWCLNCKLLKATVLSRHEVQAALKGSGVTSFKVDLTSRKAPGWAKLKELGEVGIPLLVVHGPGYESPWKSNAYTPDQVLEAIAGARGPAVSANR